jgi:hypothetical protein
MRPVGPYMHARLTNNAIGLCHAVLIAIVLTSLGDVSVAAAQEDGARSAQPVVEDPIVPEISRDGWRARIEEARQRAREVAHERRTNPVRAETPPAEDIEQIATERVLRDDSLQFGDIVSTRNGLFVFRGRSDRQRRPEDFVALPRR